MQQLHPAVQSFSGKSANEIDVVDYLANLDPVKAEELLRVALKQRSLKSDNVESKIDVANATTRSRKEGQLDLRSDFNRSCRPGGCAEGDNCEGSCQQDSENVSSRWSFQEEVVTNPEEAEAASLDFMSGIELGRVELAAASYARAKLDFIGEAGWTSIHWAVHAAVTSQNAGDDCGQVGMAECCAPAKANPEMRQFVKAFLRSRKVASCIDVRAEGGATALMFAADGGDEELCDLLLDAGADASLVDEDGDIAATWASQRGHHDLAGKLSSAGR